MESSATLVWLHFSVAFNYITTEEYQNLKSGYEEVGRLLGHMIAHPEKY